MITTTQATVVCQGSVLSLNVTCLSTGSLLTIARKCVDDKLGLVMFKNGTSFNFVKITDKSTCINNFYGIEILKKCFRKNHKMLLLFFCFCKGHLFNYRSRPTFEFIFFLQVWPHLFAFILYQVVLKKNFVLTFE